MTSTSVYGKGDWSNTFLQCEELGKEYNTRLFGGEDPKNESMVQLKKRVDFLWSNLTVQEKNALVARNTET